MLNSEENNELFDLIKKLFPICRSITGEGNRETLKIIKEIIPIEIKEIPTSTEVFDWKIPKEWNIKDAFIKNRQGEKIVDFGKSNLHVVNYSAPVNKKISLNELKSHLYTIPEHPDWIPYRTTYYKDDWGFCLSHNEFLKLSEGEYEVKIDSEFKDGSLSYGEILIEGELREEILISTHICHPSMCNDNLTGISIAAHIAKLLLGQHNKYSYRLIFVPATIGAITWLSVNENHLNNIRMGLVIGLLGDDGIFHYKKSRMGNSEIDKIVQYLLNSSQIKSKVLDFEPYGYDERQYCSPGINLAVGRLTRSPNKCYPEYHSSADNLDFISKENLSESFNLLREIIHIIEKNERFINLFPKGEPQLGKRGIYDSVAGNISNLENAMLWILNFSDGDFDLVDISFKSNIDFATIIKAKNTLLKNNLIKRISSR